MRIFVFVSCVTAILARPEAGFPYHGPIPNQHVLGLSVPAAAPHGQGPSHHQHFGVLPEPASTIGTHQEPQQAYLNHPTSYDNQASGFNGLDFAPALPTDQGVPHDSFPPTQNSPFDSYHEAAVANTNERPAAGGYPYVPLPPSIHKHIYVHVPPKEIEEEEDTQPRVHLQPAQKQKHYKIVFIKAPSPPKYRPPVIPPPQQNEEKTLIYVLHKKPEQPEDIIIPTPAPTKPSKPEVYFIKYRTKKQEDNRPVYGPPASTRSDDSNDLYTAPQEEPLPLSQEESTGYTDGNASTEEENFSPIIAAEQDNANFSNAEAQAQAQANQYVPPSEDEAAIPTTAIPSTNYGPPTFRYYKK